MCRVVSCLIVGGGVCCDWCAVDWMLNLLVCLIDTVVTAIVAGCVSVVKRMTLMMIGSAQNCTRCYHWA